MCKKKKLYELVYCCEWLEEHLRLCKGVMTHSMFCIGIKGNKAFFQCPTCREERSEAKFEDLIREE